jgi:hypothetical protein
MGGWCVQQKRGYMVRLEEEEGLHGAARTAAAAGQ